MLRPMLRISNATRAFATSTKRPNKQTNKQTTNKTATQILTTNQPISASNGNVKPVISSISSTSSTTTSTNQSIKPSSLLSPSLLQTDPLTAWHYLPVKPSTSSPFLSVTPIKPSPIPQSSLSHRNIPPKSDNTNERFPRWLLITILALSAPFAVFARDDWRDQLIKQTESFIDWPQWFRLHDMNKIDRERSNDQRFENLLKSKDPVPRIEQQSTSPIIDKYLPQLNAAHTALTNVRNAEIEWMRSQETPAERDARLLREKERQSLIDEISHLEDAIRSATNSVEMQVAQEIERAEDEARVQSNEQVNAWAADMKSRLDERLHELIQRVVEAETDSFTSRLDASINEVRNHEIEQGVESIKRSLIEAQSVYEQATRQLLTEDGERFLDWAEQENHVRETLLAYNRAAFEDIKHEFDDLQDYLYLSSNIHRVNLAVMAIEEALSNGMDVSHNDIALNQWRTLISAGYADPVIASAVRSLSNESLENGLASYDELRSRWKQAEFSLFTSAYDRDPTHSSIPSHIFGMLAAMFTIKSHDLVNGQDDISRLQRCGYWIDHPDLDEMSSAKLYEEAANLSEQVRQTIDSTFFARIAERAAAEIAINAIKARIQTLEIAFIPQDK